METARLFIRKFNMDDLVDFICLISDKMKSPYSNFDEQFPTDEGQLRDLLAYFSESEEFYAIEQKNSGRLIGFICLNYIDAATRNLGYCIHTQHQRKGFAFEAINEIKRYAKEEIGIVKLVSGTAEENIPSFRLLQKAGFCLIEKKRGHFVNDHEGNPITFMGCTFECEL